jgi:hypothetical protein
LNQALAEKGSNGGDPAATAAMTSGSGSDELRLGSDDSGSGSDDSGPGSDDSGHQSANSGPGNAHDDDGSDDNDNDDGEVNNNDDGDVNDNDDDDGTADQGPGDVLVSGGTGALIVPGSDDGTPDQARRQPSGRNFPNGEPPQAVPFRVRARKRRRTAHPSASCPAGLSWA